MWRAIFFFRLYHIIKSMIRFIYLKISGKKKYVFTLIANADKWIECLLQLLSDKLVFFLYFCDSNFTAVSIGLPPQYTFESRYFYKKSPEIERAWTQKPNNSMHPRHESSYIETVTVWSWQCHMKDGVTSPFKLKWILLLLYNDLG